MKDIPIFTSPEGIATLILREIPTRREAYVLVRSVFTTLPALLQESGRFCRAAGAERVYFGGDADFSDYPVYARLIERAIERTRLPQTAAVAVPVAEGERGQWAALYRERFLPVPAAQSSPSAENACFICDGDERIGLGQIRGGELLSVAALKRGRGADCVCALAAQTDSPVLTLLCAEENLRAMQLYDRLGFSRGTVKEIWYRDLCD